LEIKIRYSHRKAAANTNTKKSDPIPNAKIFRSSEKVKELWVIG
jgi:hypothetical protein